MTDRGRRRLHQRGEHRPGQHAEHRVLQRLQQFGKTLVRPQRRHRFAHRPHAIEEQAQPEKHGAVVARHAFLPDEAHHEADRDQRHCESGGVEGHDLRRHRRAHVGTEDHADRLHQGHQAGTDETHDQHRRHRGRLDHCSHDGPGESAQDPVSGQLGQQRVHLLAGGCLQPIGHLLHAIQEQRQPAEQLDGHGHGGDFSHVPPRGPAASGSRGDAIPGPAPRVACKYKCVHGACTSLSAAS
jgi:hypothetical protein